VDQLIDDQLACLYCQLDSGEDTMEDELQEIRFVPEGDSSNNSPFNPNQILESLQKQFCESALLNPDPEVEDEGDFFYDEKEIAQSLDTTKKRKTETVLENIPGQFDDVEEEMEENEENGFEDKESTKHEDMHE